MLDNEVEEQFYDNLDQLKGLIDDDDECQSNNDKLNEEFRNDLINSDMDIDINALDDDELDDENNLDNQGNRNLDLLAEFSDYDLSDDEYDEQDFMDAIREANNFKVKRKNKKKTKTGGNFKARRERILDPEVVQLLSEANEAFVRNDIQVAEQFYNQVIKKDAKNFGAYKTLGDIYQLQGRYNDCCNSWFLAAHLNSSDWRFWKDVARLSSELNHLRQAIYCYSRAISINHEEWDCIYARSTLYKQMGQLGRALEGFQKLFNHNPYDSNILRELAVLYVEYNRINDAIGLYTKLFEQNITKRNSRTPLCGNDIELSESENEQNDSSDDGDYSHKNGDGLNRKKIEKKYHCIPFDWSALNILAELFLKQSGENQGIKIIKQCARWIQHRESQTFWDDIPDDAEFDNRRFKNVRYDSLPEQERIKGYNLPIDIRIRLGLLRLHNKNILEAMNHFQFLYDENFFDIADLYFEVAIQLAKLDKFYEAIEFFTPLLQLSDYQTVELYKPLGKCYKEVEDYKNAKNMFEKLVELNSTDLETKLTLAEIHYHLGEHDKFNKLLLEVVETRKKQATDNTDNITREAQTLSFLTESNNTKSSLNNKSFVGSGRPLLEDIQLKKMNVKKKKTPQDIEREKYEREKRITSNVLDKYRQLHIYKKGMEKGDENQITLWIDTASDLIDIFSSIKNFFVKSRSKKFVGIIKRTRKFNKVIDYRIERLSKLSEGDNLLDGLPLLEERVILTSATELRGLTYDQWFELFMELALNITKLQNVEDGLSIVETAQEVNVFIQDPERAKMMKFVKLAIVLQLNDEEELLENLRGLLNQFQFNRKVYQLFLYCLIRGRTSLNILSSTVQQKFFLRQLKAFDSIRYSQHVSGQASITNKKVDNPGKKSLPYLYYIYAMLLYSSKGFLLTLQYLNRVDSELSNDPMINFMMGLSHIHRSMQRLTGARHFQILQGFKYLFQYYQIRMEKYNELEKQEAQYNIARSFHLIGLFTIAVKYYNKVLDDYQDDRLKRHAAYNLMTIYNESGNAELSNYIMEKYLTI